MSRSSEAVSGRLRLNFFRSASSFPMPIYKRGSVSAIEVSKWDRLSAGVNFVLQRT